MKSSITRDSFWHPCTPGIDQSLHRWLHDHGSLTQRIRQRCDTFSVQLQHNGLARIAHDEAMLLNLAPKQLAWSRDVFLHADNQPVVFAHSTCAPEHLRGAWGALAGLGNKPLGAMLFAHPLIERMPLAFKLLRNTHPLYRQTAMHTALPSALWARRSLFYLHHAPLLVTEVFLPEISGLRER